MYVKPQTRVVDPTIAASSCTPCDPRSTAQFEIYVSPGYTQVFGTGWCAPPGTFPTSPGVGIDLGEYVARLAAIKINSDGGSDSAGLALLP